MNQVLWPVDHDAVRSIPLGNGSGGDKWVWHYNAKGVYKVRSGYRVIMDSRRALFFRVFKGY